MAETMRLRNCSSDRVSRVNFQYRDFVKAVSASMRTLVGRLATAPKLFHPYIRKTKDCLCVGPMKSNIGVIVCGASEMSALFVDAFSAVFVPGVAEHQVCIGVLDNVLCPVAVACRLSVMNSSSAADPAGLYPHMLRTCSKVLLLLLYLLLVRSFNGGVLPTLWKNSMLIPPFKSGNRRNPWNYRLVRLTSFCCKICERIIVSQLVNYLDFNSLLSMHQFGFRKDRSV